MRQMIRIGTRKSPLAMIQAKTVAQKLENQGAETEIIQIDSAGDIDLTQPIYELGITGVFTKNLDIALLNDQIDIAVHSLKDIPTSLPKGLDLICTLERDYHQDVMVWNGKSERNWDTAKIGTGSLRRIAFLKNKYPKVSCENIRGNVQTRIQKMYDENLDGVVFSLAGIKRLDLDLDYEILSFMTSAPGQGTIAVMNREGELEDILNSINHPETYRSTYVERQFLATLEGGCTAPVGAFAEENTEGEIHFKGEICSLDGKKKLDISDKFSNLDFSIKGEELGKTMIANGAQDLFPKI